ncbi:MAG: ATP-binding protein [Gemmatimonadota bacterium]
MSFEPSIDVVFDSNALTLSVHDNGVGMDKDAVAELFARIGASSAALEAGTKPIGEFGIGVISYFMAADAFVLETYDGETEPISLRFTRSLLAGGSAEQLPSTTLPRGTKIVLSLRDRATFELLVERYAHWCRDAPSVVARVEPEGRLLPQGGAEARGRSLPLPMPDWVERTHLGPVSDPVAWGQMTGVSEVAVLYRGVFVQEFDAPGLWGIQGSIDVDPKHFKPKLNREGFIGGEFEAEVKAYLQECHPSILLALSDTLEHAVARGDLSKWTEQRCGQSLASKCLAAPRSRRPRQGGTQSFGDSRHSSEPQPTAGNRSLLIN